MLLTKQGEIELSFCYWCVRLHIYETMCSQWWICEHKESLAVWKYKWYVTQNKCLLALMLFDLDQCMIQGYGETLKSDTQHSTDHRILFLDKWKEDFLFFNTCTDFLQKSTSCTSQLLSLQCSKISYGWWFWWWGWKQNVNEVPEENINDRIIFWKRTH